MKSWILMVIGFSIQGMKSQEIVTPGVDIRWTLKESVGVTQEICFVCPGLVSMGVINTAYCGACFGIWIPSSGSNYCLHYKGPNQLDYDKVREYSIPVSCQNGATLDSTTVVLKIIPNTPPSITQSTSVNIADISPTRLTTLQADDYDVLDTLEWIILDHPYRSKFDIKSISRTNAGLDRKTDLSEVCDGNIVLLITVTDSFNPAVGTVTVTISLTQDHQTPEVTNLNRVVHWNENRQFYSYFKGPNVGGGSGSCSMTTDPVGYESRIGTGGCGSTITHNPYFQQNGNGFDFETDPPINFTLVYQKGQCPSKPVWLKAIWKDVNEKPELSLTKDTYSLDEGMIDFEPEYVAKDPDSGDTLEYKIVNPNTAAPFEIDLNSGRIYTNRYFSAGGATSVTRDIEVYVTDTAGLTSTNVKITMVINDVNDHAPTLDVFTTTYYFLDCDAPGPMAIITAQDEDPGVNGETEFVVSSSGTMQLTADGTLELVKAPFDKQFDTINIQAVDKGTPVKHSDVKQVSVIGQPCPTTPAPYVPPTTQPPPPPTTTPYVIPTTPPPPPPTAEAVQEGFLDDPTNIALMALAGLAAFAVMIGATCFIIRCSRRCCTKATPRQNMVRPQKADTMSKIPPKKSSLMESNSDHVGKKKPDADAESGVYSEGEEAVFEEANNSSRKGSNSIRVSPVPNNDGVGNLSARSNGLDF